MVTITEETVDRCALPPLNRLNRVDTLNRLFEHAKVCRDRAVWQFIHLPALEEIWYDDK